MKKIFTINGKEYKAREFDFELVCDLEDMGISIDQMGDKPLSLPRSYFALCAGFNKSVAAMEIQEHIINGGTLDELQEAVTDAINNSGFFRAISENKKKEDTENQETENKKK